MLIGGGGLFPWPCAFCLGLVGVFNLPPLGRVGGGGGMFLSLLTLYDIIADIVYSVQLYMFLYKQLSLLLTGSTNSYNITYLAIWPWST